MKRNLWKISAAIAALIVIILFFSGSGNNPGLATNHDTDYVISLLDKRQTIMENVLRGNITYEEGCTKLKDVEKGGLYTKDTNALAQYKDTDYEKTLGMDIISIEESSHLYDKTTYVCEIQWRVFNYSGYEKTQNTYDVTIDWENETGKLVTFDLR